jgi:hypothetical protein
MRPEPVKSSDQSLSERGAYTLANDVVIEWFHAFIQSFRKTNPTLPLTVIPYNSSIAQVRALANKYQFTIMEETECSGFDALEAVIMGQNKSAAMFRKWACFFGSYANFIYLDSDMVITSSLDEILNAFCAASYDFIYFDVDISMAYTPDAASEMRSKYGSAGFNAGAFVSRKGAIKYDELMETSQKAAADRNKFVADQVDQPFLNYVFDTLRRRTACVDRILPKLAAFATVRQPLTYDWKTNVAINAEGKILPFVHWPGCAYPTMLRPGIFLRHRTSGISFPARIEYDAVFYFRRYRVYFLKAKVHWTKVIVQFFTSRDWRKFYLCKLIGIKIKLPV